MNSEQHVNYKFKILGEGLYLPNFRDVGSCAKKRKVPFLIFIHLPASLSEKNYKLMYGKLKM